MTNYMQFTKVSELTKLERLNNSRNGNPRFHVTLANGQAGKTKSDAGFAYAICANWQGKPVKAQYRITQAGNIIFTDLELSI